MLKELKGSKAGPLGVRYGCLGRDVTGPDGDAFFARQWGAWVCAQSRIAMKMMERHGTMPVGEWPGLSRTATLRVPSPGLPGTFRP